jgi:hypothetical protein
MCVVLNARMAAEMQADHPLTIGAEIDDAAGAAAQRACITHFRELPRARLHEPWSSALAAETCSTVEELSRTT